MESAESAPPQRIPIEKAMALTLAARQQQLREVVSQLEELKGKMSELGAEALRLEGEVRSITGFLAVSEPPKE